MNARTARTHTRTHATRTVFQFSFKHGAFEKVNYLGYDDHVVINRSISFLLGEDGKVDDGGVGGDKKNNNNNKNKKNKKKGKKGGGGEGGTRRMAGVSGGDAGGKLLTILTVRAELS